MKIKPEHYEYMKAAIGRLSSDIPRQRDFIQREGKAKDPDKRLRWDMLYLAGLTNWICTYLYPYANDDHIDTALRSIMKEIIS